MAPHDPHSRADLDQGRTTQLDLTLHVDFESSRLHGVARIQLADGRPGTLDLDARDLEVRHVRADGRDLPWALDQDDPILGQRLHILEYPGTETLDVAYSTSPGATAAQWLSPAQTAGGQHPFLFTQCQPIHARSLFPCQDTPSVRFTYSAQVDVPAPLSAVMSAASRGVSEQDRRRVFRFEMPQPIPSYLLALGVGDLSSREVGPRTRVYAEPEIVEQAAWEFAETERMLREAEALFGPYGWERYDILVMPPSFPYGGMENPRLTFCTPTVIIGTREMTNLIAHELAHSWTGNLVTNATWEHFWLNEGWTTYAERRILEAMEGSESAQMRAASGRNSMFTYMHQFGMQADPTRLMFAMRGLDPDAVLTDIAYEKGYSFLVLLERTVGRPAFDRFVRDYIATYQFQSITTEEFVAFLARHFPQIGAQVDLQEWLYGPGFPASAPEFRSSHIEAVEAQLRVLESGQIPSAAQVRGWTATQVYYFLQRIPRRLTVDHCRSIEHLFGLQESGNVLLLYQFYEVAVRSGYREALPRIERLLSSVGRRMVVRPIFQAMAETEWSRALARPLLDRLRARHHPITVAAVELALQGAGV